MQIDQTILVTGASGFIAKHIVLQLLDAGYRVRGSVRNATRADQVRAAMQVHLVDPNNLENRLSFAALDLTTDSGWGLAMEGVDAVLHTASPFPMAQPDDQQVLIRPAVDGTLRALRAAAAAGGNRVVLTSSVAAINYGNPLPEISVVTEDDWTDPASPYASAYARSKTLAERAAWEFVAKNSSMQLTTINPSFVVGPPLDGHFGTSLAVMRRALRGKDPMVPQLMFDFVDVRDIAAMHVAALSNPATIGERIIGSSGSMWFVDFAKVLKAAYPARRIPTLQAPNLLIRVLARFDKPLQSIVPMLGKNITADNSKARAILGMEFIPVEQAITDAARYLVENGYA